MKKNRMFILVFIGLIIAGAAQAAGVNTVVYPLIITGASYGNSDTPNNNLQPFEDSITSPLGGTSVMFGNYMALGDYLSNSLFDTENVMGSGVSQYRIKVINKAQAGATSFGRADCSTLNMLVTGGWCSQAGWLGTQDQLENGIGAVTVPQLDPATGEIFFSINPRANFILFTLMNDCLHSNAFDGELFVAHISAPQCTDAEIADFIARQGAAIETAIQAGFTPIVTKYPAYADLDLQVAKATYGFDWLISEERYLALTGAFYSELGRITEYYRNNGYENYPVILDVWATFVAAADGFHPDYDTVSRAGDMISRYFQQHGWPERSE